MAQPRAHQILVRGNAEHVREQPQEVERADVRPARRRPPGRSAAANARRSRARFPPRGGDPGLGRSGLARRPETTSTKRLANSCPTSSRPISLRPSAAACASSPSTINSGSGGAEPIRQISARSPIVSTSSGRQEERQALVAADVIVAADIFVAGMADQDRSGHQLEEAAAAAAAETALAHIGDRVAGDAAPRTACRPVRRCSGSRTPRWIGAAAGSLRSCREFSPAGAAEQPEAARRTGSCWLMPPAPSIDSSRRLEMTPPLGEILSA